MPTIAKVRDNGVWKTPVVFWIRDAGVWKKVGSLQARENGVWSAPQVWAPNPPTLVQPTNTIEYDKTTLTWSAATGAPVKHYEVRQTTWDASHTIPVATTVSPPVTGLSTSMAVAEKTHYSYNVRAISTDGTGNVPSAYSNTVRWRIGNAEKFHWNAVAGWDERLNNVDVPSWPSGGASSSNDQHPPWWAFDGTGANGSFDGFGWLKWGAAEYCHQEGPYQIGYQAGWDAAWCQANPPNRVLLTHIQMGHRGAYGWKWCYPVGWLYSLNRQRYIVDLVDTAGNQKVRCFDDCYAEANAADGSGKIGTYPIWSHADTALRWVGEDHPGWGGRILDASEGLRIYITEWAPVYFVDEPNVISRCAANVRYARLWYHNWNTVHHYDKIVDELAYPNTVWS